MESDLVCTHPPHGAQDPLPCIGGKGDARLGLADQLIQLPPSTL